MLDLTVPEIKRKLQEADETAFAVLERSLSADTRKGVRDAVEVARRRLQRQVEESQRLAALYEFEEALAQKEGASVILGLDEVGRGPIAGPLAVGGVVLDQSIRYEGLNDSKQVSATDRERLADQIQSSAVAWTVQYVEPEVLDAEGMSLSLVKAFKRAIDAIEAQGVIPDLILLDGNPLHLDPRERNIIKGDARCASIAAASIVAKVARDSLMDAYDRQYPGYGFASNKGYASAEHREALNQLGLSPIHRISFCGAFLQPRLF